MQYPSQRVSAHRGFTIVELLVTIMLGALLMAIAVPSFKQLTVSNRLTTQANEFASAIQMARSEAIKRNNSVSLCRTTTATATACANASASWGFWIIRTSGGTVVRNGTINTFNNGIKVGSTLTGDMVTFTPDGLASTGSSLVSNHQISVCSPSVSSENTRTVVLGTGSRISTSVSQGTC